MGMSGFSGDGSWQPNGLDRLLGISCITSGVFSVSFGGYMFVRAMQALDVANAGQNDAGRIIAYTGAALAMGLVMVAGPLLMFRSHYHTSQPGSHHPYLPLLKAQQSLDDF